MKTAVLQITVLIMLVVFNYAPTSQADELVEAEIYQPAPLINQTTQSQLKLQPLNKARRTLNQLLFPAQSMSLGEPSADELAGLKQTATKHKALKIGIQRLVPALPAIQDWVWMTVLDGQAAQFVLSSASASSVRALLQLEHNLPDGVELRIFSLEQADEVYGPYSTKDFKANPVSTKQEFWTPTVSGSQLGVEVFVPEGINPARVKLTLPAISHIAYDFKSSTFKAVPNSYFKFSSCDVSMACAPTVWQATAKAVARYVFTNSAGNSFLCTGTLLADKDTGTQIPYFMTAAHCIDDAAKAATMDFYWFYQESSCGSGNSTWVRTVGGADLLASRSDLDMTLVRMSSAPPVGSMMSGWALESMPANTTVVGIHHGLGNPKQFSQGSFVSYADVTSTATGYLVTPDVNGDFTQVIWSQGITAQGSSGSGLWTTINGNPYFKATLVGGGSSCSEPTAPDEYTRLERFQPSISNWLEATGGSLTSLIDSSKPPSALVDGVIIARYLGGKRGADLVNNVTNTTVNLSQLEGKLDFIKPTLDIDGDNNLDATKDGMLIIRYLMGLRDNALIGQMDLTNAKRKTAAEINQYIEAVLF